MCKICSKICSNICSNQNCILDHFSIFSPEHARTQSLPHLKIVYILLKCFKDISPAPKIRFLHELFVDSNAYAWIQTSRSGQMCSFSMNGSRCFQGCMSHYFGSSTADEEILLDLASWTGKGPIIAGIVERKCV